MWHFGKLVVYGNTLFEYSIKGKRIFKSIGNKHIYYIYDGYRLIEEERYGQYSNLKKSAIFMAITVLFALNMKLIINILIIIIETIFLEM